MSREVLHFTYDVPSVVKTAIKIFCEKKLYDSDEEFFAFDGNNYDRKEVKFAYGSDVTSKDGILETQSMKLLEKLMPSGGTITDTTLSSLTELYLKTLFQSKKIKEVIFSKRYSDDDFYVECDALGKRVKCAFGEHYDVVVNLLCDFFGVKEIQNGDYSNSELADFVRNQIRMSSSCSSVKGIANDIEKCGIEDFKFRCIARNRQREMEADEK